MTELAAPRTSSSDAARAAGRVTARAAAAGLVDVAYRELDSPVGALVAAATDAGLVRLAYRDSSGGLDAVLDALALGVSPRVVHLPVRLDEVARQLEDHFAGRRRSFDVPVDLRLVRGAFGRAVLDSTAGIPFGATGTYASVASAAGSPRAVRAAGNALGANPVPIVVPCHRVLRSGGGLGGYTGGVEVKQALLALERGGRS